MELIYLIVDAQEKPELFAGVAQKMQATGKCFLCINDCSLVDFTNESQITLVVDNRAVHAEIFKTADIARMPDSMVAVVELTDDDMSVQYMEVLNENK
jgi:hypothetical protein